MLALAGKVSDELRQIIMRRPKLFAQLLRELRALPDHAIATSCAKCAMATGDVKPLANNSQTTLRRSHD